MIYSTIAPIKKPLKSLNLKIFKGIMTTTAIKKQLNEYLPLLSLQQQELLLDMAKSLLHVEPGTKRISLKQYNKELAKSEKSISKGKYMSQKELEKLTEKW